MKRIFSTITAVFLAGAILTVNAGADYESDVMETEISAQEDEVTDPENINEPEDNVTESETAEPETNRSRDEELLKSIDEKTEAAIAASDGVETFAVKLTDEEMDYIDRIMEEADSDGMRGVTEPVNLGGSLSEYANDYFLDQLNSAEKSFYISLFNACQSFAQSNSNPARNLTDTYATYSSSITDARLRHIVNMFYYANPQFFFLTNGYTYGSGKLRMHIYADFQSSEMRNQYSAAIADETEYIMPVILAEKTELAMERVIYKYISAITTYKLNSPYDQSIASVFVKHYSVCNGYALAVEYLCNAADIDCIVAVGQGHAWNIINLGGTWYELDVTWMDTDDWVDNADSGRLNLKWRNKSHATFLANDPNNYHIYKDDLYNYCTLPPCTVDMFLEDENYVIDNSGKAYQYNGTQTVLDIPDDIGITSIAYPLLYNNTFVTGITIPEGVTGIGDAACSGSSALRYVNIPVSVTSIGVQAFYNSSVSDIYYAGTQAQWEAISMGRQAIPANCVVHYSSQPVETGIEINTDNFPDVTFRTYVADEFDLNGNGILSESEIAAATEIDANYDDIINPRYGRNRIWSVQGIEFLTALTNVDISGNSVTAIDLGSNTALESLNCSYNNLETLDLSKNVNLKQLSCSSNYLTSLCLDNTAVTSLTCSGNICDIGNVRNSFDLTALPGFDASRASDWNGAEYDSTTNSLVNITANTITYKYNCGKGFKKSFTLICNRIAPVATSITATAPTKTEYFVGQNIEVDGGMITVFYDYGEPVEVAMTADMLSGYDNTTAGKQNVTVEYAGFNDSFEVEFKKQASGDFDLTDSTSNACNASIDSEELNDILEKQGLNASHVKLVAEQNNEVSEELNNAARSSLPSGAVSDVFLKMDLFEYESDTDYQKISEISEPITVSMQITDELKNTDDTKARNYFIIAIYNGTAEQLEVFVDGNTISFEIDKFSDIVIAYLDLWFGDVNGDDKVNAKDVLAIRKLLVGNAPGVFYIVAGDVNADNLVNAKDVLKIRKYIVDHSSGVLGKK